MSEAFFRFHRELNDFLPPDRRGKTFRCHCAQAATAKHMIEALGVPHTEVGRILVDGVESGFDRPLKENDEIDVYPVEVQCSRVSSDTMAGPSLFPSCFIADAHLGALARLLRMAGFDTLYDNHYQDKDIEAIALAQNRIVLTRDIELLKRKNVKHGSYVRSLNPHDQMREVFSRFTLAPLMKPFSLCLHCNYPLHQVEKQAVEDRIPPRVAAHYQRFSTCGNCHRIFWEGSHWHQMRALLDRLTNAHAHRP